MATAFLIGRILFGGYWLMNAYNHLTKSAMLAGYAGSKGVPAPKLAVMGTGVLMLIGALGVLTGVYVEHALAALLLFLVPTTFMMHQYWKVTDPMAQMGERINFMKNVALIGAILMLYAVPTPWMYAV